jgi:hypothetical protein
MKNVEEILSLPKLGKDDTFTFGCNRCGKCCREREDILLTPLDLFKIARHLRKPIQDVMQEYCESYEGHSSKIPVVRIRPREYRRTCPFAKKEGCLIHPVKPAVCALFPLGRMTDADTKGFTYFLQPVTCGNKRQTQTVRQWLDGFSILEEEGFSKQWHRTFMGISDILRGVYEQHTFNHDRIILTLLLRLYVLYDLEKDFLPQFERNGAEALRIVKKIEAEALQRIGAVV